MNNQQQIQLQSIQQHFLDLDAYLQENWAERAYHPINSQVQQVIDDLESLKPYEAVEEHNPHFITMMGDQCLETIMSIANTVGKEDGIQTKREIEHIAYPLAIWLCQHGAQLKTLRPVVNAIAQSTNKIKQPQSLERLFNHVSTILQHIQSSALEASNIDNKKAWRVLLVNHGIIATRAQNTALMETAYQNIADQSPEDAAQFFEQGMAQMRKMTYPEPVKSVVEKYFLKWRTPTTLH